ncbi:sensor histidine kinase [Chondrinema litorale]|uniref:sensor histidine kinase n=1 Tax=Chondrinema litorale TaxID=2994555 RepID=UPI0025434C47|nr:sensor histidine kinase [Chondrinema litorale]UZR96865.1 sensor histidine kinase [Chondrinema litorale]
MTRFKGSTRLISITAWLLFFTFPLLRTTGEKNDILSLLQSFAYWQFCLCYFAIFYLNSKFLAPRLLLKNNYILYVVSIIAIGACVFFIKPFDALIQHSKSLGYITLPPSVMPYNDFSGPEKREGNGDSRPFPPPRDFGPEGPERSDNPFAVRDVTSLFILVVILTLSTATESTQRWQVTERRVTKAEAEKAKAELSFLKAQINPHFLFNTLNNIYTLAVTGNEKTADSIMKLSNIMRFVTDDVREDSIPLIREVECLKDYIDLQKLRLGKKADITFEATGSLKSTSISPMILLTFVENAFKHGISKHAASPIVIKIEARPDKISFFCQNRLFDNQTKQERNGIGIKNTRQRLQHVYPSNYILEINRADQLFTVTLEINKA